MKHRLDEPLGYEPRLTRHKRHVMSSHLVQVMEMIDYISTDRKEIKEKKGMSKGLCPQPPSSWRCCCR